MTAAKLLTDMQVSAWEELNQFEHKAKWLTLFLILFGMHVSE